MAFILADRVKESCSSPGTGTVTLLGAATGYQSFSAGIGANNTTYYVIADQSGSNWEVGYGTIGAGGTTLARTTVLSSSNSGSLVNFSSGTQDVFCDYPAGKQISSDYPNALGVTTPNTGTFTTLTAQTEVLKGTGQNLLTYSNTLTNAIWATSNATVATTSATTDPVGGLNAFIITASSTSSAGISNNVTLASNTYTASIYAKAGTSSFLRFVGLGAGNPTAWFNLSTGAIGTVQAGVTATIQSIGNGWYRCSITGTGTAQPLFRFSDADNTTNATSGTYIYFYGAQVEIGSVTNAYVATTTTAVYGTPSLSFSGVAGIGLESTGALYVSPAGTGALQAQATDSTATGGNARGTNAVDWQTKRGLATQVASATYATIGGGAFNLVTSSQGVIAGGANNTASGGTYAAILGGNNNVIAAPYGTIVGGLNNGTSTQFGYFNFIGAGSSNTGTATAAVTTQAAATNGVTNGSTAVTLSGSNAAIKVGQLITGTGIVSYTYVAAISGTSLTLSQNANATGTPTLSFYTPHGVVVGGGNNQATGSYSFIGGGGDAGTAANKNTASGDWSFVGGGAKNTASGIASVICGGGFDGTNFNANQATGIASFLGGGGNNSSTGNYSSIAGGANHSANGNSSGVFAGRLGNTRSITGNTIFSASNAPVSSTSGSQQSGILLLGRQTTDATSTVLASDANAAGTTNQVILPNNSAYLFKATVISGVTGAGNTSAWKLEGAIKRGATAGSTAIVGTVTTTLLAQDVGAATWAVTATADTTNGGLKITVTGQAATTIRWVCKVETTEMTY